MKPLRRAACALLCLALGTGAARAQERGELFEQVFETLADRFHDREFRKQELPRLADTFRGAARAAASLAEERAVIHGFLAQIPASHLALYSRATYEHMLAELSGKKRPTLGCDLVGIGARYFVHDVLEGSPAADAGVLRGDCVVAIDGVDPGTSERLDWRSDDAALPDAPLHRICCAEDERVRLVLASSPGATREVSLRARRWSAIDATKASVRRIARGEREIGYLRLRFMHMQGVAALVKKALEGELADCDGVVIDLRGRGGNAAAVTELAQMLERRESAMPLAFLIDAESRSAKEAFAFEVRKRKLGVLVGERTAGALLPASFQDVGQESVLMFPAMKLGGYTREIEGKGVEPDVRAEAPGRYSRGGDGILEAAIETLQG